MGFVRYFKHEAMNGPIYPKIRDDMKFYRRKTRKKEVTFFIMGT